MCAQSFRDYHELAWLVVPTRGTGPFEANGVIGNSPEHASNGTARRLGGGYTRGLEGMKQDPWPETRSNQGVAFVCLTAGAFVPPALWRCPLLLRLRGNGCQLINFGID